MDERVVDLTEVVDKVAQFHYERHAEEDSPKWEDIPAGTKFFLKEAVTPLVFATLRAAGVSTSS